MKRYFIKWMELSNDKLVMKQFAYTTRNGRDWVYYRMLSGAMFPKSIGLIILGSEVV